MTSVMQEHDLKTHRKFQLRIT